MRRRMNRFEPGVEFKGKLNQAFKDLRKEGLIARQNFMCCGSCAGYSLTEMAVNKVRAGKVVNGAVFYHNQDKESLYNDGTLYLGYGNLDSTELGEIGLPTIEVGKIVVRILEKNGLQYEWDGTEDQRILIKA